MADFSVAPYFDDFDENAKFLKILFRPGYGVQARELTQAQTILQNQISRFGNHIFRDGTMVIPGNIGNDLVEYVKLNTTTSLGDLTTTIISQLDNTVVTGKTSGVKALVILSSLEEGSDPNTLYVKYLNSGTTSVFINGEDLISDAEFPITVTVAAASATGTGSIATIQNGIYYIKGNFVLVDKQIIILDKYASTPSYKIGLQISEEIVTPEVDQSLYDNAIGSPNQSAPGAHRYKIATTLIKLPIDSTSDADFIELLRLIDNVVQLKVTKTDYSELEKTFARRTYDESGDYLVNGFNIELKEHRNNDRGERTSSTAYLIGDIITVGGNTYVAKSNGTSATSAPSFGTTFALITDGTVTWQYAPKPAYNNGLNVSTGNEAKFVAAISPGKAYVKGFELEKFNTTYVDIDKSRTFNRSNSAVIGTTVGNYIKVENLFCIPDTLGTDFPIVSLYSLRVSTPGTANGSKIGEARVRWIEKDDVTNSYKVFLFDINMNAGKNFDRHVKSIYKANTAPMAHFTADILPDLYELSGSVSSNATSVTGTGTKFLTELVADDYVSISGQIARVSEAVSNNNTLTITGGPTVTNPVPIYLVYNTLYEPDNAKLIFPFPNEYLRMVRSEDDLSYADTVINKTKYFPRRQSTVGGTITIDVDSSSTDTFLPYTAQNYTVINDNGTIASGYTVSIPSPYTSATISGLTANTYYTILAGVRQKGLQEKTKTLVLATLDVTTLDAVSAQRIYLVPDVYKVLSIKQAPAFGTINVSNVASLDISNQFMLDDGQRDTHYDAGSVYLAANAPKPTGSIRIEYEYFDHSAGDYFTVDSYKNVIPYNEILPLLRDSIDFRPRIEDNRTGYIITDIGIPKRGYTAEADYSFYNAKWVNLELDMYGNFFAVDGIPSVDPQIPQNSKNSMHMAQMYVEPYTLFANEESIEVTPIDNKRYTMRDIGKLEKRISNIEYYTSLSLLEQETKSLSILDNNGLDRFKNGFLVDSFEGHGIGNTESIDYKCAIDASNHVLRPMYNIENVDLVEYNQRLTNNYTVTGDIISLPYINQEFISQKFASRVENVNPFAVFTFIGVIEMKPSSDNWFETTELPANVISKEGNFKSMLATGRFGTSWNAWKTTWVGTPTVSVVTDKIKLQEKGVGKKGYKAFNEKYGKGKIKSDHFVAGKTGQREVTTTTTSTQTGQSRTGLKTSLVAKIDTQEIDNKLISTSIIPYMRSRNVLVVSRGLKPSTQFHAFFDNIPVDSYITPASKLTVTNISGFGSTFDYKTNVANDSAVSARMFGGNVDTSLTTGDVITGQSSGATAIVAYFETPNDINTLHLVNLKGTFQLGEIVVGSISNSRGVITSSTVNQIGSPIETNLNGDVVLVFNVPNDEKLKFRTGNHEFKLTTSATNGSDSTSQARGSYSATGILNTNQKTILATRNAQIVQEAVSESKVVNNTSVSVKDTGWYDPLAQSFYVRQNGGAFLTKIDVYFASKDASIPVQLELREMVNGYPGKKVLPNSRVLLLPEDVNISTNTVTLSDGRIYNSPEILTSFEFESPIYVADNTEYCFVLLSDSNNYNVWISQLGDKMVGGDRYISEQPYAGVLFKSQNASTWTANQDQDLTFVIHRAKFDTNVVGSVKFNNLPNTVTNLTGNVFQTLSGNTLMRIWHPAHGFNTGESVTISGATGTHNGVTAANMTGNFVVSNIDTNSYTITLPANATASGFFSDSGVHVSRNIRYEKLKPNVQYLTFTDTNIDFNIKTTSVGAGLDVAYTKISGEDETDFTTPKYIKSDFNENGTKSFELVATLSSSNDSVSPIIDTHRLSMMTIGNIIDDVKPTNFIKTILDKRNLVPGGSSVFSVDAANSKLTTSDTATKAKFKTATIGKYVVVSGFISGNVANNGTFKIVDVDSVDGTYIKIDATGVTLVSATYAASIVDIYDYYIDEICGLGASSAAKYLTKTVTFENSCTNFNIMFAYNMPNYTGIDVYYKLVPDSSSVNVDIIPFTLLTPEKSLVQSNDGLLYDAKYSQEVDEFTAIIVKIVLKSINTAYVPTISDFRLIACA